MPLGPHINAAIDGLFAFIGVTSLDGTLLEAGGAAISDEPGNTRGLGCKIWDHHCWSHSPSAQQRTSDAIGRARNGEEIRAEIQIRTTAGALIWSELRVRPARDPAGHITHMIVTGSDLRRPALLDRTDTSPTQPLSRSNDVYVDLIDNAPFGIYLIDADFRLIKISAGAQKVFAGIQPLIGRDFADILRLLWTEPFAVEAIARFRHTLATGEPYSAADTRERRRNLDAEEAYDWRIERVTLPDGTHGVVCYFYDLSERRRFETALQASERRFRGIFENAGIGIAIADPDGLLLQCNSAFASNVGSVPEDLQGRLCSELMHAEDRDSYMTMLRKLAIQETPKFEVISRSLHKQGGEVWLHRHCSALGDWKDPPRQIVMLETNMTATRRAQARQHLLMRELAHRSKNLLAVVQSIANHTLSRDVEPLQARLAFQGRIQALARTYGSLTNDAFEGAALDTIVAGELEAFHGRATLDGPSIVLTAKAAQVISLVIHELATNAAKHGAFSVPQGSVDVTWRIAGTEQDTRLQFDWIERNGPPVTRPASTRFGTTIISAVAGAELGATPQLSYLPQGFRYHFDAPLPPAGQAVSTPVARAKLQSPALRSLYDAWVTQRGQSQQPPLFVAFELEKFVRQGTLTIVEVDSDGTVRGADTIPKPSSHPASDEAARTSIGDSFTTIAEAYVRCARDGQPCHEHFHFDFGDEKPVIFERLLVPYIQSNHRTTHVVSLSVLNDGVPHDARTQL